MKNLLLSSLFLLIGCQSSTEKSFNDLSAAFTNWYYKFHPIEATRFGLLKNHDSFHLTGDAQNDEYIADVARFIIELSQIDPTKLTSENRIDYDILFSKLEQIKFLMTDIRPWEWDPTWILMEIYEGLFLISEVQDIEMDIRVSVAKGRVKLIPGMINDSKEMMVFHSPIHLMHANLILDSIIKILDVLPIKLNSDNLTLDEIDVSIETSKESLIEYGKWLKGKYKKMPVFLFPKDLNLLDNALSHYVGEKYSSQTIQKLSNKKRIPLQNELFNLSLPIYLHENDEPVWLDRDDTLEVIHWTLDHILNKPENQVSTSGILSYFYESISKIEQFINSQGVIPKGLNKRVKLIFSPEYIFSNNIVNLFGQHPNRLNSEIVYYIENNDDSGGLFPLISQEIDLINAKNINPGSTIQIAHAQKYSFPIRYMFPDPVSQEGWKIYAANMLLDEGYEKLDSTYQILLFKEKLMITCRGFVESEYYSSNMEREDAISFLRREAFLSRNEAVNLMVQSELSYFSGIQAFIGMVEMESIKKKFVVNAGNTYNLFQFNQEILKHGIIPFNQLKKVVLSL